MRAGVLLIRVQNGDTSSVNVDDCHSASASDCIRILINVVCYTVLAELLNYRVGLVVLSNWARREYGVHVFLFIYSLEIKVSRSGCVHGASADRAHELLRAIITLQVEDFQCCLLEEVVVCRVLAARLNILMNPKIIIWHLNSTVNENVVYRDHQWWFTFWESLWRQLFQLLIGSFIWRDISIFLVFILLNWTGRVNGIVPIKILHR